MSDRRIVELDGLRAFAVLMILLGDIRFNGHLPEIMGLGPMVGRMRPLGFQILFVMSGFVVTWFLQNEFQRTGRVELRAFLVRRFFRIIPAFWAYLLVVAGLWAIGEIALKPVTLAWAFGLISDMLPYWIDGGWFTEHSWSLSTITKFYIVLPFLLWVVLAGKRRAMFVVLALLYLVSAYATKAGQDFDFLTEFKYIIAGILLALGWRRLEPMLQAIPLVAQVGLLGLLLARGYLTGTEQNSLNRVVHPTEAFAVAALMGWIITHPERGALFRAEIIQWLGRCSLSLYLWHQLFVGRPESYLLFKPPLWLGLPLVFVCAALSYYFIERPGNRLGHALSAKLSSKPA